MIETPRPLVEEHAGPASGHSVGEPEGSGLPRHGKSRVELLYEPEGAGRAGMAVWREMGRQLWHGRELTWRLFVRDMTSGHRESLLGSLWAVFPTLATAATFTGLIRARLLSVEGTALPYPLFVLVGMTLWQFFAGGLEGLTGSLVGSTELITKVRFPREALLLATLGRQVFDLLIRGAVVAAAFALLRVAPAWGVIGVPLVVIPLCLLMLGLGCILALANAVARDVGHVLRVLLPFWMFLTPIVYPAPTRAPAAWLNLLNPVSPFVIAVQDLISRGRLTQPGNFAIGCIISLLLFLLGWRLFFVAEASVVERV